MIAQLQLGQFTVITLPARFNPSSLVMTLRRDAFLFQRSTVHI